MSFARRISEEALGWFLVASLYRRFTSMATPCCSLLGGGVGLLGTLQGQGSRSKTHLHHTYDQTHRINVTTPSFEAGQHREDGDYKAHGQRHSSMPATGSMSSSSLTQRGEGERQGIVESSVEDEATNISSNFFSAGRYLCCSVAVLLLACAVTPCLHLLPLCWLGSSRCGADVRKVARLLAARVAAGTCVDVLLLAQVGCAVCAVMPAGLM